MWTEHERHKEEQKETNDLPVMVVFFPQLVIGLSSASWIVGDPGKKCFFFTLSIPSFSLSHSPFFRGFTF